MERKTIGGFIAALRKAHGMTQRELAERLNVSDKTVSRWERDDGAPDLSLIPVIAEIFGVTCDELLRGERKSATDPQPEQSTPKGEKERRRILSAALSRYRDYSFIAMGVSVVGFIVALICNLAALRAVLGFLLGCIFFAASVVCQVILLNRTLSGVADSEVDEGELGQFRYQVLRITQRSFGLTAALVGFTFPLVLMDSFVGLSPDNMLLFGAIGTVVFLGVFALVCHIWDAKLLRRGFFTLGEKEEGHYWARHGLRKRCAQGAVIAVVITAVVQLVFNSTVTPDMLAPGTTFTTPEDYVAFMETPGEDHYYGAWFEGVYEEPVEYFDEYGNLISEEEALTTTEEVDGVTLTYLRRNNTVSQVSWDESDGQFRVTLHTHDQYRQGNAIGNAVNAMFVGFYAVEVLVALSIYLKQRKRV